MMISTVKDISHYSIHSKTLNLAMVNVMLGEVFLFINRTNVSCTARISFDNRLDLFLLIAVQLLGYKIVIQKQYSTVRKKTRKVFSKRVAFQKLKRNIAIFQYSTRN